MGNAQAELDYLDAALDVAAGVGQRFAVLTRQQLGQLVDGVVDQFDKPHQHPGTALGIPCGPALLGLDRGGHGRVDV
ncbi:Uncharacterised protein [Mycobacterium tuberculosis]|uniref:Uncharacterized protein n=1 Tax=Mycobacterium tuberculosis TaxID=1773 RepID=A0A655JR65_MYCTX|nr:Uncharacterised protein [Mycobacterium tuberculosis]COX44357.1 Uncharacterised protein [Mycobacterium tuberculosis]CPA71948.1 Uncharacterised protein [Mycobacterium tuberculosis]